MGWTQSIRNVKHVAPVANQRTGNVAVDSCLVSRVYAVGWISLELEKKKLEEMIQVRIPKFSNRRAKPSKRRIGRRITKTTSELGLKLFFYFLFCFDDSLRKTSFDTAKL